MLESNILNIDKGYGVKDALGLVHAFSVEQHYSGEVRHILAETLLNKCSSLVCLLFDDSVKNSYLLKDGYVYRYSVVFSVSNKQGFSQVCVNVAAHFDA